MPTAFLIVNPKKSNKGTVTCPPPTPKKPLKNPENNPIKANTNIIIYNLQLYQCKKSMFLFAKAHPSHSPSHGSWWMRIFASSK
jgi:hypothetical protein